MAAADSGSVNLPSDAWLRIFSYLDYKDLIRCCRVNRQFHDLCNHNSHWRRLCQKYWLVSNSENATWKECFKYWYDEFGRYINCYARVKGVWNKIEEYKKTCYDDLYADIKMNNGIEEETLEKLEKRIGHSFPEDMRCSYRIHNGESSRTGLFGHLESPNHYRLMNFPKLQKAVKSYIRALSYLPLTYCCNRDDDYSSNECHYRNRVYVNLRDKRYFPKGSIFFPSKYFARSADADSEVFLTAEGFTEWIEDFANKLCNDRFLIFESSLLRLELDPSSVRITNYITVSAYTGFVPELSSDEYQHYHYGYQITLDMSADAPDSAMCRLETSHWRIVDERGNEKIEETIGIGPKKYCPIMKPDKFFWCMCGIDFETPTGSIEGYLTLTNLTTGGSIRVECPRFTFVSLPSILITAGYNT